MKYTDQQIAELKQAVPLWRVAQDRIPSLKKRGDEWWGLCPLHQEKTPSFSIYRESGTWIFCCHGCSEKGNVFQFVQKVDKIGFSDAVEKVASLAGWQKGEKIVSSTFQEVAPKEKEFITFPLERIREAEQSLAGSREAIQWLASRGITLDTARRFHLGFVKSAKAVSPGHPWVDEGWIIFPTIEGETITCLKYRSVKGKKTEDGTPAILRKSGMATGMMGLNTVEPFDDLMICEGEIDLLTLAQAGYIAASLPSAGFSPTPEMRDRIVQANTIYLAGDMDAPGQQTMTKLWSELRERTYLIEWPEGCKDANETYLKICGGDTDKFRELVEKLKQAARSKPIPHFYDLKESLRTADDTNPMDDPRRLHWPWKAVDEMAVCRPGSVVSAFATYTGSGKTTLLLSLQLNEALKHGSVVINYSAELSPQEISTLVTAIVKKKDRLTLNREDYDDAAEQLRDARFYVGYNPDASSIRDVLGDGTDRNPGILEWAIRRLGANIVVLDHLHFFTSGEKDASTVEAASMTRIKNLAVKYNLIFIVVGQSRKAQPGAKNKVSEGSDAKGSEAFVSTANTTFHIHRDIRRDINFDDPSSWPSDILDQKTDIRLYKCRTKGPGKAVARLWFEGATGRFREMVPEDTR